MILIGFWDYYKGWEVPIRDIESNVSTYDVRIKDVSIDVVNEGVINGVEFCW